jgi:hypothetical protein
VLTTEQLAAGWENRGTLPEIPNSRAMIDRNEGAYVAVLQACIAGIWTTVSILSATRSPDRATTELLGRKEASELGVPWFNGARLAPALEVVR